MKTAKRVKPKVIKEVEQRQYNDYRDAMKQYKVVLRFRGKQLTVMHFSNAQPSQIDVLHTLIRNADEYKVSENFKHFCTNFGYDIASRQALRAYKECGRIAEKLKRFLGEYQDKIEQEINAY